MNHWTTCKNSVLTSIGQNTEIINNHSVFPIRYQAPLPVADSVDVLQNSATEMENWFINSQHFSIISVYLGFLDVHNTHSEARDWVDHKEVPSKWVLTDSNGHNVHHIQLTTCSRVICILHGPPNIQDDQIEEGFVNFP